MSRVISKLPFDIEPQGASPEDNTRYACRYLSSLPIGVPPGLRSYRYQQLRQKLVDHDQKRQQRQQHLEQLQYLQRLLEPYQDPQKDIQPNLITRDGELVQALEKMRMLVARVGGRIAQQKKGSAVREEQEYLFPGSKRKLEALLDEQI